jgi:hypothetical protein
MLGPIPNRGLVLVIFAALKLLHILSTNDVKQLAEFRRPASAEALRVSRNFDGFNVDTRSLDNIDSLVCLMIPFISEQRLFFMYLASSTLCEPQPRAIDRLVKAASSTT